MHLRKIAGRRSDGFHRRSRLSSGLDGNDELLLSDILGIQRLDSDHVTDALEGRMWTKCSCIGHRGHSAA